MQRQSQLKNWIATVLKDKHYDWAPITGDASFRRYFRVTQTNSSMIACDSPPDRENNAAFLKVARALQKQNVCVPDLIAVDEAQGFWLLTDFGDDVLLKKLNEASEDAYYDQAFKALLDWHEKTQSILLDVPRFDHTLLEMENTRTEEWFFTKYLGFDLSVNEQAILKNTYAAFQKAFQSQPQVLVHRDFHSRNLMLLPNQEIGVIDFQDAVWGPVCYDAISLFKDCYYVLPKQKVKHYAKRLQAGLTQLEILSPMAEDTFWEYFELTGLQRHYKVLGIFSRLFLRDGHERYLADLPRVLRYVLDTAKEIPALHDFYHLMQDEVAPRLCAVQSHCKRA